MKLLWRISQAREKTTTTPSWVGPLQRVELDESPSEDGERPDDAHGHEHTEQDVVQNHGDELPLLRCLEHDETREQEGHL